MSISDKFGIVDENLLEKMAWDEEKLLISNPLQGNARAPNLVIIAKSVFARRRFPLTIPLRVP